MESEIPKTRGARLSPDVSLSSEFQRELIALIPHLRAFSRLLCGRRGIAEDMAQEALVKAWRARECFQPGSNLKAWVFTILRNEYCSHGRRAWRESHWDQDMGERIAGPPLEQEWAMELADTARALGGLDRRQQEALILVAAGGLSHADAASVCAAPVGTMKSRVARARAALLNALDGDTPMPPRARRRTKDPAEHILAQLSALAPGDAVVTAQALPAGGAPSSE